MDGDPIEAVRDELVGCAEDGRADTIVNVGESTDVQAMDATRIHRVRRHQRFSLVAALASMAALALVIVSVVIVETHASKNRTGSTHCCATEDMGRVMEAADEWEAVFVTAAAHARAAFQEQLETRGTSVSARDLQRVSPTLRAYGLQECLESRRELPLRVMMLKECVLYWMVNMVESELLEAYAYSAVVPLGVQQSGGVDEKPEQSGGVHWKNENAASEEFEVGPNSDMLQ